MSGRKERDRWRLALADAAKVKTWLFTTLHREFLGKRRRMVRFPHHELTEVEAELPEVPPELPAQLDWDVLSGCLARLNATFQSPVALFYLEDYSYNEIAEFLAVPLGTVKSRIARGIAPLQKMLNEQREGEGPRAAGRGEKLSPPTSHPSPPAPPPPTKSL